MTTLIRFDKISLAFADQFILVNADFSLGSSERVCLVGRNGAGKSTTLKLIKGELLPDDGRIEATNSLKISVLDQALVDSSEETVRDYVTRGLEQQLARMTAYRELAMLPSPDQTTLREIEKLERAIDAGGGWSVDTWVDPFITQLDLPADKPLSALSGGWRRRVALAKALVCAPDLLLLDEPTNHLDITTIDWLEAQVTRFDGAVLFVTHDRSFAQRVATRVVDLDRGQLRSWPGGYREYLRAKTNADSEEDRRNSLFDKKLAEEEVWVRQGVKAREHRNEGRVRNLEALREERGARIKRPRTARIHINESQELSGRKIIEAKNLTHSLGGQCLLDGFSLRVMRGERLGIIGNNGVGKTTLLRLLLGEITPDHGTVKLGTNLEIAYFDQLRRQLDPTKTVAEIVGEGRDYISIGGKKKHVVGYLTDFLFSPKRAMAPITALSGGERNRVILAKLFTRSANLLVLDEPTNDLDVETLEALETRLTSYTGTLIIVSHDRHFLDAVVTSTLVFEADGVVRKYPGGYSDWLRQRHELAVTDSPRTTKSSANQAADADQSTRPKTERARATKLSYKLQRELDALPDNIDQLEAKITELQREVADPEFYQQPRTEVEARLVLLRETEEQLEQTTSRWSELEEQVSRT